MESIRIDLPSGLSISNVGDRLSRFCEEEYAFYDGIADCEPNQILPLVVIVTVAVNSFVNDAAKIRRVHKGIAVNCNPLQSAAKSQSTWIYRRMMRHWMHSRN